MEHKLIYGLFLKALYVIIIAILVFLLAGCANSNLNNKSSGIEPSGSISTENADQKNNSPVVDNADKQGMKNNLEEELASFNKNNNSPGGNGNTNTADEAINDSAELKSSAYSLPVLSVEIIDGPVILEDNSLCYYRLKAEAKGNPAPKIYFSKDDSNGAWGKNIAQINLKPGETYELTVKAVNSSGTANALVVLNWENSTINNGFTDITSEEANPGNYFIEVSLSSQTVKVFYKGSLLKEIICSSGAPETPTPKGTFKTSDKIKYAWLPKYNVGAYYFIRFYGSYLFHSTPFTKEGVLIEEERQNLGKPVSHGCIRTAIDDSKWLYDTIPSGVIVKIY